MSIKFGGFSKVFSFTAIVFGCMFLMSLANTPKASADQCATLNGLFAQANVFVSIIDDSNTHVGFARGFGFTVTATTPDPNNLPEGSDRRELAQKQKWRLLGKGAEKIGSTYQNAAINGSAGNPHPGSSYNGSIPSQSVYFNANAANMHMCDRGQGSAPAFDFTDGGNGNPFLDCLGGPLVAGSGLNKPWLLTASFNFFADTSTRPNGYVDKSNGQWVPIVQDGNWTQTTASLVPTEYEDVNKQLGTIVFRYKLKATPPPKDAKAVPHATVDKTTMSPGDTALFRNYVTISEVSGDTSSNNINISVDGLPNNVGDWGPNAVTVENREVPTQYGNQYVSYSTNTPGRYCRTTDINNKPVFVRTPQGLSATACVTVEGTTPTISCTVAVPGSVTTSSSSFNVTINGNSSTTPVSIELRLLRPNGTFTTQNVASSTSSFSKSFTFSAPPGGFAAGTYGAYGVVTSSGNTATCHGTFQVTTGSSDSVTCNSVIPPSGMTTTSPSMTISATGTSTAALTSVSLSLVRPGGTTSHTMSYSATGGSGYSATTTIYPSGSFTAGSYTADVTFTSGGLSDTCSASFQVTAPTPVCVGFTHNIEIGESVTVIMQRTTPPPPPPPAVPPTYSLEVSTTLLASQDGATLVDDPAGSYGSSKTVSLSSNRPGDWRFEWVTVDSFGTPVSTPCIGLFSTYSRPYVSAYHGDVVAAGDYLSYDIPNQQLSCESTTTPARIDTHNQGSGSFLGAGTNIAAIAQGPIQNFASARGGNSATAPPKDLTFANTVGGTYGGEFVGSTFDCESAASQLRTYLAMDPSLVVKLTNAQSTITSAADLLSTPSPTGIYYYRGDLTITGNIDLGNSWTNMADMQDIKLISLGGDINISKNVTRLDGTYIAIADGNIRGRIFTCSVMMATIPSQCNQQLEVNGSLMARRINFWRSNGTVFSAAGSELDTPSSNIAEVVGHDPTTWIPRTPGLANKYDALVGLPPLL